MVQYRSVVQCPHCGFKVTERMPAEACVRRHACPACERVALTTERCVFCEFGRVPCPSAQAGKGCVCEADSAGGSA